MAKIIYHQDGKSKKILTEDMKGEESFTGSMPDAEEIADVEDISLADSEVGLYNDETPQHPREVGLGEEVEKGEEKHLED